MGKLKGFIGKLKGFRYSGGSIFDWSNEHLGMMELDENSEPFVVSYGDRERIHLDWDALFPSMEEEKVEMLKNYIVWALTLGPCCSSEWVTTTIMDEIDRHAREIWEFVKAELSK